MPLAHPRIVLYQPDIPGNTGTILRLAACLDLTVDLIEPAGFRLDNKSLQRAGLHYAERARLVRHADFEAFEEWRTGETRRLILATTRSRNSYTSFEFQPSDCLLFGRESAGVPDDIHQLADETITIPMAESSRSINLAVSVGMICGEVLRQTLW